MMKLWSHCCAEKGVPTNNRNADAYVEATVQRTSKDDHLDDLDDQIYFINRLPTELLFKIFHNLDDVSLFHCYFVCKRWRSIVFDIAFSDESNVMWHFLYRQYQMESYDYKQNTDSSCLLSFQELIENSLKWNYRCSITLSISVPVIDAVQMTLYRDNIIVVTSAGVEYFDKETFKIKKKVCLDKCNHFIENDYMVARSIKREHGRGNLLKLFGKRCFDDCEWEFEISTSNTIRISTTKELDVRLFKIEDNCCFVVTQNNTLYSYDWQNTETPFEWLEHFRCRSRVGVIVAINVGRKQVYLQTSSGALYCYQRKKHNDMEKIYTFSGFKNSRFVQLVHGSNLVLGVPDRCSSYVVRIIQPGLQTFYRLEFARLTCVTEHGILLFLGYSDGKVKIISPTESSREHIKKQVIDLCVFDKEAPPPVVVSIVVHVVNGKQIIFVATTACVYQLTATFLCEDNIWDKENRVGLIHVPRVDQVGI